mgnify:CR=1 FL=1
MKSKTNAASPIQSRAGPQTPHPPLAFFSTAVTLSSTLFAELQLPVRAAVPSDDVASQPLGIAGRGCGCGTAEKAGASAIELDVSGAVITFGARRVVVGC